MNLMEVDCRLDQG